MISMEVSAQAWRDFDKALQDYAFASGKTLAEAINKKAGDLAMISARNSPKAARASIGNLWQLPWWPKFIAKILRTKGWVLHYRRKARGKAADVDWVDTPTGKIKHGRKTMGVNERISGAVGGMWCSEDQADKMSRSIIARRIATIGGFRAIFLTVAQKFGKPTKSERQGRNFLTVKMATPEKAVAAFTIPFSSNRAAKYGDIFEPDQVNAQKKVNIAERCVLMSIPQVIADMNQYIERKYRELGRTFSGIIRG